MSLKFRLVILSFLQYFIWGSWLISLGSYLGNVLGFDGIQIGSIFGAMGIVSLFMPGLLGIVADRWIPAQKLLGICHLLGVIFLIRASAQGLFMIMTNDLGAIMGSYLAGMVVDKFVTHAAVPSWSTAWFIFSGYALVVAILFAILFKYKYEPEKSPEISH